MSRPCTLDTGGPDDVFAGALVTWMHTPRGGYGYTFPVPAVVRAHALRPASWVRIDVERRDGSAVSRRVDIANLRWRTS